jgi:eukaryotic-like serine/threonine-protein kinase
LVVQQTTIDGRYLLVDRLGSGGMAEVYLAHDEVLGRNVALKVMREAYANDQEFVERFKREARSAASLAHPSIVQIYDQGRTEDSTYYIAMEYVSGGTLKEYMTENGPLGPRRVAAVAVQIAEALEIAHERGVVHRDIKPQNVLVSASGDIKVADFGIARAAAATAISRTSAVLGTVKYMSPEQATGELATPASDLYSLGVVLYEMLTGEVPFDAGSSVGIAMKHVNEPPRPPKELRPEIPEGMNALVTKLLAKDPADRYASAAELLEDLDRMLNGPLPAAVPAGGTLTAGDGYPDREDARQRRRRLVPLMAALALLALLGAAGRGLWDGSAEPEAAVALEDVSSGAPEEIQQSPGPEYVKVPDVVGLNREAAQERLAASGFESGVRFRQSPAEDIDEVLGQSVPGGEKAREGSKILLTVGAGPPDDAQGPDLSGSEPAATQAPGESGGSTDTTEGSTGTSVASDIPSPATPSTENDAGPPSGAQDAGSDAGAAQTQYAD